MDIDLENWMNNLPEQLKKLPLTQLAIPGTHDSMTYCITRTSPIAPDFESSIQRFTCIGYAVGLIMAKWAKTQEYTVVEQLKCGIRYFDLRVATKDGSEEFYFVHGMYAGEVADVLSQIKEFLDDHPNEVVIIDFNHFYAFTPEDHTNLMTLIKDIFTTKLIPLHTNMDILTLEYLITIEKQQVLCIYRSDRVPYGCHVFWPSSYFPTPWPNTLDKKLLIDKITENLERRNARIGYITQFLLTPDLSFVLKNSLSSLKKTCAQPLINLQKQWLEKQRAGKGGVNIVITDFMDLSSCQFSKDVIALNFKLLN